MKFNIDINKKYKETTVVIQAYEMTEEVDGIIQLLKNKKKIKTIVGKRDQKMVILNPNDILLFYSVGQKIKCDTLDDTFQVNYKLYELEDLLKDTSFVRISKSSIVNINQIKDIELSFNGSLVVNFNNQKQEFISRRYVKKVKEFIGIGG